MKEAHLAVFVWVLERLAEAKLLRGGQLGVDGTTLLANAAMGAVVRRTSGEGYREYVEGLARDSGVEVRTTEELSGEKSYTVSCTWDASGFLGDARESISVVTPKLSLTPLGISFLISSSSAR